jgi:oxygen-independent coproporphyrinogen-3 oxidase
VRLRPEHLSIYIFEIDDKSRLGAEVLKHGSLVHASDVPDEGFAADAYEGARDFLKAHGYRQYEISNFAAPGRESLHNLKYWQLEPYIGLGAGAHSFDGAHRWSNTISPSEYAAKLALGESPIAEFRDISRDELIEEYFFTGLRQADGVDLWSASERWSASEMGRWQPVIESLAGRGLLERRGNSVRLTESAYVVSNEVFQEFLP